MVCTDLISRAPPPLPGRRLLCSSVNPKLCMAPTDQAPRPNNDRYSTYSTEHSQTPSHGSPSGPLLHEAGPLKIKGYLRYAEFPAHTGGGGLILTIGPTILPAAHAVLNSP
jgi:hypothetical protein